MRKKLVVAITIWIVLIISALVIFICGFAKTTQYETTNISDYGEYTGNYDNKAVESFINSFFPEKIEPYFENINYSYKAQKGDTYAYEAYLEFTISDKEKYNDFIVNTTQNLNKQTFFYDTRYTEYVISDEFTPLYSNEEMTEGISDSGVSISYAKIGKILCLEEEQKVIFIALGVYDGGLAEAEYLNVYFDKFNINPREYKTK